MMHADVRREPAQDSRQIVVRATIQGGLMSGPLAVMRPKRPLELVLNVEEPHPDRARQQGDWQMHEQKRSDADEPYQRSDDKRDGAIRRHGAQPGFPTAAHKSDRQPLAQHEQIGGADAEPGPGLSAKGKSEPTPPRQVQRFLPRRARAGAAP